MRYKKICTGYSTVSVEFGFGFTSEVKKSLFHQLLMRMANGVLKLTKLKLNF